MNFLILFYLMSIVAFWIVYYFVEMVGKQKNQGELWFALKLSVCPFLNDFAIVVGIVTLVSKRMRNCRSLKWNKDHFKFE